MYNENVVYMFFNNALDPCYPFDADVAFMVSFSDDFDDVVQCADVRLEAPYMMISIGIVEGCIRDGVRDVEFCRGVIKHLFTERPIGL